MASVTDQLHRAKLELGLLNLTTQLALVVADLREDAVVATEEEAEDNTRGALLGDVVAGGVEPQ